MIKKEFIHEYFKVKKEYYDELSKLKPEKGLKNISGFIKKAEWAWNNVEPKLHVTFGNAKLPKTTCIVNLGTWFNCSGRKEGFCDLCEFCYDKSPEVRFKERIKDRLEQEIFWRSVDYKTFAFNLIEKILEHNNCKGYDKFNIKTKLIRWCEVGEIRNQYELFKIAKISDILYNTLGIKSYIYTHNKNLNFNIDRPNLTVNGSNFMVDNEYRVVNDKELEFSNLSDLSNKRDCICDCNNCSYCSQKNNFILIEEVR